MYRNVCDARAGSRPLRRVTKVADTDREPCILEHVATPVFVVTRYRWLLCSDKANDRVIVMNNKAIIQKVYQGFAAGDIEAVTAAFADDIEWTEAEGFPLAGTYVGPQSVVEKVFMRLGDFSDNWAVAVERYVADGDTVVADGKYTWKNKQTGAPCQARMAHVWTLADGKVTSFLQHVDTARVRELIA